MEAKGDKRYGASRTITSLAILVLLAGAYYLFHLWVPFARLISGHQEVSDLGVDVLQPAFVSMIYILIGVFFSTIVAAIVERQLRENSFATWSRFAVIWVCCFFGYCWVAGSLL